MRNFRNMNKISVLLMSACLPFIANGQCDGERFRYTSAFSTSSVSYDIPYGSNVNVYGVEEELVFDWYEPVGDFATDRPLIIMAHGGFFLAGSNDGEDVVPLCEDLARMGYAVASISYRLGIVDLFDLENELTRAVWRGVHDSRSAVRYFRDSAEGGENPWGIDPDQIYLGGVSAGGFIALHHAYLDDEAEIPAGIDLSSAGLGGGIEGESGTPGVSSDVAGIFNICGALKDVAWMQPGDEPVVSVHGTVDATVPYAAGEVSLMGFPVTDVNGSATVHDQADAIGLIHCFIPLEGADHVPHVTDNAAYTTTLATVAGALSSWACPDYPAQCGEYDFTSSVLERAPWLDLPRLYPNPTRLGAAAQVVWSDAPAGDWNCHVRDLMGRQVWQAQVTGHRIDLPQLPAGTYLLQVLESNTSLKWVVQ